MNNQIANLGIIIVNYNGGELLSRCIDHLYLQKPKPEKVIIVDNFSEDGSIDSLPVHAGLEVIKLTKNIGFAAANNLPLKHMGSAELVMTLNPDAFVQDGCLTALLAAATHKEYDRFACRMMKIETIFDGTGDNYHITGIVWRNLYGTKLSENALVCREVFSACAGAALYRKKALDEVGGFDENFFCYVEDIDLGYRLKLIGKRCLYIPAAVVNHIGSAISGKYPGFALSHGHRNLLWTFVKNTPTPLLLIMLPLHLLMTCLLFFFFLFTGEWRVYLTAKKDAIKGLPRTWQQRKEIQRRRHVSLWQLLKSYNYYIYRRKI